MGSVERRCTASCNLSGTLKTDSHRAFPSKHGKPCNDRCTPAASVTTWNRDALPSMYDLPPQCFSRSAPTKQSRRGKTEAAFANLRRS
eukprot:1240116-Alexandrium_andersonii.AAC.1